MKNRICSTNMYVFYHNFPQKYKILSPKFINIFHVMKTVFLVKKTEYNKILRQEFDIKWNFSIFLLFRTASLTFQYRLNFLTHWKKQTIFYKSLAFIPIFHTLNNFISILADSWYFFCSTILLVNSRWLISVAIETRDPFFKKLKI